MRPYSEAPPASGWMRVFLRVAIALCALLALAGAASGLWLWRLTHPDRHPPSVTPAALTISYEEITFRSVDGIPLAGWFIKGQEGAPALLLCHDLGEDKSRLINTAVPLSRVGYSLFLFDFRGHGASGGSCTLGLAEKRDILGALDYLASRPDIDKRRFGFVGAGMGAHAGILAARDRKEIRALVLDSPYPDVRSIVARSLGDNELIQKYVTPVPLAVFDLRFRISRDTEAAEGALKSLADRDLLFIVAKDDTHAADVRRMYEKAPEGPSGDKNLLQLTGSRTSSLYDLAKAEYDQAVLRFFEDYLPLPEQPPPTKQPKRADWAVSH